MEFNGKIQLIVQRKQPEIVIDVPKSSTKLEFWSDRLKGSAVKCGNGWFGLASFFCSFTGAHLSFRYPIRCQVYSLLLLQYRDWPAGKNNNRRIVFGAVPPFDRVV
jgi:hypothetical protein